MKLEIVPNVGLKERIWLIEVTDGGKFWATGLSSIMWTPDVSKALRFHTQLAARNVKLQLGLWDRNRNGGYDILRVTEMEYLLIYEAALDKADETNLVPEHYWDKLMEAVRKAPTLPDECGDDLPPLI